MSAMGDSEGHISESPEQVSDIAKVSTSVYADRNVQESDTGNGLLQRMGKLLKNTDQRQECYTEQTGTKSFLLPYT